MNVLLAAAGELTVITAVIAVVMWIAGRDTEDE